MTHIRLALTELKKKREKERDINRNLLATILSSIKTLATALRDIHNNQ